MSERIETQSEFPRSRKRFKSVAAAGILLASVSLFGCDQADGPMEKAGEKADEAMQDASSKVGETIEKGGDKVEEATDKVKEKLNN